MRKFILIVALTLGLSISGNAQLGTSQQGCWAEVVTYGYPVSQICQMYFIAMQDQDAAAYMQTVQTMQLWQFWFQFVW